MPRLDRLHLGRNVLGPMGFRKNDATSQASDFVGEEVLISYVRNNDMGATGVKD